MTFFPVVPFPWLSAAFLAGAAIAIWSACRGVGLNSVEKATAGLLRLLALALLLFILANPQRQSVVESPGLPASGIVLIDTSASMGLGQPPRIEEARAFGADLQKSAVGRSVHLAEFDGTTRFEGAPDRPPTGAVSHLAQALKRVMHRGGKDPPSHIVVVSDGAFQDVPEIAGALGEARQLGATISTHVVGSPVVMPNLRLAKVRAPASAGASSVVEVSIVIESTGLPVGTETRLSLRSKEQGEMGEKTVPLKDGRASLTWDVPVGLRAGAFTVTLDSIAGEVTTADNEASFSIGLASRQIRVLYMEGSQSTHPYDGRLAVAGEFMMMAFNGAGDIECDEFLLPYQDARGEKLQFCKSFDANFQPIRDASRTLPTQAADWASYDVIIVSDIDRTTFSPEQMEWVRNLVSARGAGFCMIGGNFSFDTGQYDQTIWEKLIPVDCTAFGFGHGWRHIRPQFPAAVKSHPILQMDDDPVVRDLILACHPLLQGYHDVRRIKPGAVALAQREDMEAPLIAVQDYGRGRTMAFLSDSAGGWGTQYQARWGPQALAEMLPANASESARQLAHDTTLPPNEFYRRFWINTVRWLGEKSVRRFQRDLIGRAEEASANPGKKLPVSAEIRALADEGKAAEWRVSARLDGVAGTRTPLAWDREAQLFSGEIPVPAEVAGAEVRVLFDAQYQTQGLTDAVTLPLARLSAELADLNPNPDLMSDIAKQGGGLVLNSPLDDAAAWKPVHAAAASSIKTIYTEPMWDSPLLWLVLGCCCLAEWAIRRKTLTAAASVLVFCLLAPPLPAVEPAASSRVLIIFGEPGDEEHLTEYKGLATLLQKTFIERFSLPAEHVILLTGWKGQERFCDRDTLLAELTATANQATAAAPSWIIFLGHSNPTAAGGKFNVPGQDPDAQDLGAALKEATGPLVIVHTTSSSGRFTRQLAGAGRTIISATLPGEEDNETDFGRLLPGVLADPATDADHDGTLSVIELFRACATTVTEHYKREGFVQKETPNLEADGDGRGTQRPSESDAKAAALIRLPISPP